MQDAYIWNKLHLYRKKIIFSFVILFLSTFNLVHAQKFTYAKRNNPNYDDRKFSYGFLIGLHTTSYQIKYSEKFVTTVVEPYDTLYAIEPSFSPGFSLGFIVNYKLADFFDLRVTPKFAFYEHRLKYVFSKTKQEQLIETVMVELPLLLKYKSERRGNIRMYMVGGVKPSIEASGKSRIGTSSKGLEIKGSNLNLEAGFGFDLYYPLFKFSPEIRFSKGIANMIDKTGTYYAQPLQRVNTNTISVYFLFQ